MAETTETATNPTDANTSSEASTPNTTPVADGAGTDKTAGEQPGTQTPPEGDKPAEKTAESKPEGAPESYDFKAPEGTTYDNVLLDNFSNAAKDANLTQDAAQKLLDKLAPSVAARQAEQIEALKTQWADETKADKEIGGEKLQENLAVAKKAMDTFATPELRKLFDDTGLGNNIGVIRFLVKAGKAISEDTFVSGAPNNKSGVNAAAVLYDNTTKKE
jgi:hypothetical protein